MRWWFRYHEELVPRKPQEALSFGSLIHAGAEAHYRGEDYRAAVGRFIQGAETPWEPQTAPFVAATALALLDNYVVQDPVVGLKHEVADVEKRFRVPLRSPKGRCYSRFILAGKRDLNTRDPAGNHWRWDHKTGQKPIDPTWIEIDDQMETYVWADSQQGIPCGGIVYNQIRKPVLKPRKGEKPAEWGARLSADIASRPEFYYQHELIVKTRRHLARVERDLWNLAHEIGRAPIHRNPWSCSLLGCAYRSLCASDTAAMRSAKYRHEDRHSELKEDE